MHATNDFLSKLIGEQALDVLHRFNLEVTICDLK
jgi:hypothetical protein